MSLRKQRCEIGLQPVSWRGPTSPRIQRRTQPVGIKRASGSLSGWLLWGRRCIFKCSRRKPPPTQRHSSPPDSQSSLRHGMGVRNAFLRNCLLPPASLSFRGILMGFLTKTRLFRDKGCYRLASHDDFDGRRQHWLEVKAPPKMLSTHYSSAEKRIEMSRE